MPNHYQIIFKGKILLNFSEVSVKEKLAALLKIDVQRVESLFTGKEYILKKDLTLEQANRYKIQLEKIGMLVEITAPTSTIALQTNELSDYTNSTKNSPNTNSDRIDNPSSENSHNFYNSLNDYSDDDKEDRSVEDILYNGFNLPVSEIISETFDHLGRFLFRFSFPFIIISVLNIIIIFITEKIFPPTPFGQPSVIASLLQGMFTYISAFGLYKIALDYLEDKAFSIENIFWGFRNALSLLAQFAWLFLYMIPLIIGIVILGVLLMFFFISMGKIAITIFMIIIIALVISIYMVFFLIPALFVRDSNMSAHETIKASYKITSKQFFAFLKFYTIIGLMGLAMSLPCFIVLYFGALLSSFILFILSGILGLIALCASSGFFCLSTTIACDKILKQRQT